MRRMTDGPMSQAHPGLQSTGRPATAPPRAREPCTLHTFEPEQTLNSTWIIQPTEQWRAQRAKEYNRKARLPATAACLL